MLKSFRIRFIHDDYRSPRSTFRPNNRLIVSTFLYLISGCFREADHPTNLRSHEEKRVFRFLGFVARARCHAGETIKITSRRGEKEPRQFRWRPRPSYNLNWLLAGRARGLLLSLSLSLPSSPRNTPYNQRIRTVTRLSVNEPKRDEDEVERKEREKKERKKRRREGGIRRRGRGPFETHESFSLEGQWVRVDGSWRETRSVERRRERHEGWERRSERGREREIRRGDSGRLKARAKRGRDRGERRSSVGEVIDTVWRRRRRRARMEIYGDRMERKGEGYRKREVVAR